MGERDSVSDEPRGALELVPCTLAEARRHIAVNHSHNKPPTGWLFGTSVRVGDELAGVGIASRPTAIGWVGKPYAEVTRVCTTGHRNACSMLYGALARAAIALGYKRVYTYTLASECASCVKAAGFVKDCDIPARDYIRTGGGRYVENLFGEPTRPEEAKVRWLRTA